MVQVFLTVGGVTKFIPSTGVTLPFVSYGGSSIVTTFLLFSIIQGLYIIKRNDEEETGRNGGAGRMKELKKSTRREPVSRKKNTAEKKEQTAKKSTKKNTGKEIKKENKKDTEKGTWSQ